MPRLKWKNALSQSFAEKYGKFCYSTRFGFSASRSYAQLAQAAPDSMLAFEIGGQIFVRRHSLRFEVRPDSLFSVWSPFPGITVETEIRPTPTGHIRRHKIHSEIACTAWDCGFAVPRYAPGYTVAAEDGAATAANAAWAAPCAATERPKCSTPGPLPISMTPTAPFPPGVMQSMPATASGIAKL